MKVAEGGRRLRESAKEADAFLAQEREEAERSDTCSLSQQAEALIAVELKRLALPESLRERVRDLAIIALDKEISSAVDMLAKDTRIDDRTRESIRTILKGVLSLR